MRGFNQQVKNGYAKFKSFPGCNSKEMLHYIEPTLETGFYDSAMFHVGVNDLLNNKLPSSTDNLMSNLVSIVNKCKSLINQMNFAIFLTLTNLIKTETCCTKNHNSTINLLFKSHYTRLKPKIIYYRNYKNFNEIFLKGGLSGRMT